MARRKIVSMVVEYDDGKKEAFKGNGTMSVYTTRLKQRVDEGASSNQDMFIKIAQTSMDLGEVAAPKG